MIDLKNTYIANNKGELKDLWIDECVKQGIADEFDHGGDHNDVWTYLEACDKSIGGVDATTRNVKEITLSDFTRKTVVDAVNHYKGQNSRDHIIFKDGRWSGCDSAHWQQFSVCTFAEFNQCVEELSVEAVKPKPFLQTGEAFEHTKTLNFILERMINIRGEHESVDYIHKLRNAIIFVEKSESPKQKIELPNPRMKTEYVHCSIEDAKKYHCDELFFRYGDEKIEPLRDVDAAFFIINQHKLCRKVEREYTWQEEAAEFIANSKVLELTDDLSLIGSSDEWDNDFAGLCSIVHNAKVGE